jgi:hypothetical protein
MKDITLGKTFGKMTAVNRLPQGKILCRCECGKEDEFNALNLRRGTCRECPCAPKYIGNNLKHGMSNSPEWKAWSEMRNRCDNPKNSRYYCYGKRGISVCERWRKFKNFFADMGRKPSSSHSIERIDTNGNYEPDNCKWAAAKEQANNVTNNRLITYAGKTRTVAQWAEELEINYGTLISRLNRGLDTYRVLQPKSLAKKNILLTYRSETRTMREWAKIRDIPFLTLYYRIKRGWPADKALNFNQ